MFTAQILGQQQIHSYKVNALIVSTLPFLKISFKAKKCKFQPIRAICLQLSILLLVGSVATGITDNKQEYAASRRYNISAKCEIQYKSLKGNLFVLSTQSERITENIGMK